ncbi:MAG: hypothetical protein LBV66_01780, partial [Elusimicrobiota bacterium]|nr:hypothetical protein [Elusimicrobiota bacterium]
MKKLLLLFISLLLFAANTFAEIKITDIKKDNDKFNITLNDSLKIMEITLKTDKDGAVLEFPAYINKGKVYKQIIVLRKDFNKNLAAALKNNQISKSAGDIKFKTGEFEKVKNHKTIAAFCSIIFEDVLEVKCRVMKGKTGFWIAWPSVKQGNKW